MEGEEEEIYGGELPEDDGEEGMEGVEKKDDDETAELDAMKARLKEMEDEANKLREMQSKVEEEMNAIPGGGADGGASAASREEADSRSIFVGQVDFATTPEELQLHFQSCGTVNRVTILTDKYENPKGFAYVEFLEADAVQNAILLNETEVHGRKIKVAAKRTNVPGMKAGRGRGRGGRFGGFNPYGMMMPMMMMPGMGFGRGRGRGGRGRGGPPGGRGGRGRPY